MNADVHSFSHPDSNMISFSIVLNEDVEGFLDHCLADFPFVRAVYFPYQIPWLDNGGYTSFSVYADGEGFSPNDEEDFTIGLVFGADLSAWFGGYSFYRYYEMLKKSLVESPYFSIELEEEGDVGEGFTIWFNQLVSPTDSISVLIENYLKILKPVHQKISSSVESNQIHDSLRFTFNFPPDVKIVCEQYLLYFGQFLNDLGIGTTSNLKEESGKVLFSVKPRNETDALDRIREALAIYLNLPSSPITYDESVAAMRLQQQIENLQHSQKIAARELQLNEKLLLVQWEVIQEKNVTISQKDSTIEQQTKILEKIMSKSIMMDSLENKEEFEKVVDGFEVGESKWLKDNLGIKVNPVKSLKSLGGKLLRKDEEIVTLDLVEQEAEK